MKKLFLTIIVFCVLIDCVYALKYNRSGEITVTNDTAFILDITIKTAPLGGSGEALEQNTYFTEEKDKEKQFVLAPDKERITSHHYNWNTENCFAGKSFCAINNIIVRIRNDTKKYSTSFKIYGTKSGNLVMMPIGRNNIEENMPIAMYIDFDNVGPFDKDIFWEDIIITTNSN